MNDEILEKWKEKTKGLFNIVEWTRFWNYITNLQQELEEYKDTETYSKRFLYKANKDRLNANLELVKENERLKTKAKEQSLLLIDYQDMEQKLEDYKSRIAKAINKVQLIRDLGFDYDGFDKAEDLKGLIDELVSIAGETRDILEGKSDE